MPDLSRALFRGDPFTVEVDGFPYVFPAVSADRWLDMLAAPNWHLAVLQMADEEAHEAFTDRATAGEAGPPEMKRLAHAALGEAAGRPWWEAQRLAAVCLSRSDMIGTVLLRGVNPSGCTLAAFLCVVWTLLTQSGDDMQRARTEMDITTPPPEELAEMPPEELSMEELVTRMRAAPGVSIG